MTVRGITLSYEERGKGYPVVLIHGFGSNAVTWRRVAKLLVADYRLISVDLKGFGRSAKPRDNQYSVDDQARLLLGFLSDLGLERTVLVGHSFGGGVALRAAAMDVAARRSRIDALVLIDSMAFSQKLPRFLRILRAPLIGALALRLLPPRFLSKTVLRDVFHRQDRIPDDLIDAYARNMCDADYRYALRLTARQILPDAGEDLAASHSTVTTPSLVLWGKHDQIIPLGHW